MRVHRTVLRMSRVARPLLDALEAHGFRCENHDASRGVEEVLCALVDSKDAEAKIGAWRSDPRLHMKAVLVLVDRADPEQFHEANTLGADDVVASHEHSGILRRLDHLARASGRQDRETRGKVLIVDPERERRRRFGQALRRSGLTLEFASTPADVGRLEVDVVVAVQSPEAPQEVHHLVRETLGSHSLPVVVLTDGADSQGRWSEQTASLPETAPADHIVFVVNELLNASSQKDQRASARLLYSTLCAFRTPGQIIPSVGVTYNISRGGLFVRTLDLPEMGAPIWIELCPPNAGMGVHLRGSVAWRTTGGATPAGFAVQLAAHHCPSTDLATYREKYQTLLGTHALGLDATDRSSASISQTGAPRLLIADDEPAVLRAMARIFKGSGIEIIMADDGEQAVEAFRHHRPDVVLSDINMPKLGGIELLRAIRADDAEVPILITTGEPMLQSAIQAVEGGATRYMVKPIDPDEVREAVTEAIGMARLARFRRQAALVVADHPSAVDEVGDLDETLTRAIDQLFAHYQPIVRWPEREVLAYEALARTSEPAVPHPGVLFDAAERLGRLQDVARRMRALSPLPFDGRSELLFINLHPADLLDEQLYDPQSALAQYGDQVVLELTERASLKGVDDLRGRVDRLRELGFRIAVDDLGAGYAGLSAFVALSPDVAKLDMSLIRDVHLSKTKQHLVRSMVSACDELEISVVAEGVENLEELTVLTGLGCRLFQGFFFARPAAPFPEVSWPS